MKLAISLRHLALLPTALATFGCATVTRHGDVKLRDNKNVMFVMADNLVFPDVPLNKIATYRYRVRDLPHAIYPQGFRLEVPAEEASGTHHDQPWRGCRIRASLSTTDGTVFFTRTIDLSKDWNNSTGPGKNSNYSSLFLRFPDRDFPNHLSYDLEIQVLRPSLRATDALRVEAFTFLTTHSAANKTQ